MAAEQQQCPEDDYSELKDLRLSLDRLATTTTTGGGGGFSLCLWIYLSSSSRPPSVILHQMLSEGEHEVPFLGLIEENKLVLFPLISLHKEAPSHGDSFLCTDTLHTPAVFECPLERWIHVACEIAATYMRLHVDGMLVGEKALCSLSDNNHCLDYVKRITLVGNDGNDGKLKGYIYAVEIMPISSSIKDQFIKNPPVKLSFDDSCISDGIEEGDDGVWSIVGGKVSCRRNFSVDIILVDALGRSVDKEIEIVASLLYADNGATVEKTRDDGESPLLISWDGVEFPSIDKPVTLLSGRATFRLKISQLSSKADNRLFRVSFQTLHARRYPFLEICSNPIRCISRSHTSRMSGSVKRLVSMIPPCDGVHSPGSNDGLVLLRDAYADDESQTLSPCELSCSPSLKRLKIDEDKQSVEADYNGIFNQDETTLKTSSNGHGADSAASDSESTDVRNSKLICSNQTIIPISDENIFRYCLGSTYERSTLLKEIIASTSNQDMESFSDQVSLYAGCSHHRHQILMSRRLIQEGAHTWKAISYNNQCVLWTDAVREICRRFLIITQTNPGLSAEDLEILRIIAGCTDALSRENFDRMWQWLYPVALALSNNQLSAMWDCMSSRWIEGLITKEEAESSLRGPLGLQKPGTFVLRFPTSRSWPHPDAGSLVVTYVGVDSTLHHKLLSLDHSESSERSTKPLQDLLLEEPELSQLGRVTRASFLR